MENPVAVGFLAWVFPGAGHLVQKRTKRGLVLAITIWTMFIIAVASGGAHYPGFAFADGGLLYLLNFFAKIGSGLGFVISYFIGTIDSPDVAARATFEYGGRMLEIAGLLNVLAVIDALDIFYGRKK
jgi:hypothetical protein